MPSKTSVATTKSTNQTSTPKKTVAKAKPIKYTDKSEGQPELIPIFNAIKILMKPYIKGTLKERGGSNGMYAIWSEKEVEVNGKLRPEVYFAGLLVQKGYVGFYFMPVYAAPDMKKVFQPELLQCLKGKSCFHIKKDDSVIYTQIKDALKKGYELYKERKWV